MRKQILMSVFAASVATSACVGFEHDGGLLAPTGDVSVTTGGVPSLLGPWVSQQVDGFPGANSCSNFQWRVTSQTATSLAGGVTLVGTVSGELNGTEVPMRASGNAFLPGLPPCAFSLTGTGHIEGSDAIRIEYSGTSCLGPVQGEETLRRPSQAETPAPPPPPPPEPPPPPAPAPNSHHVAAGPTSYERAAAVVFATAGEFPWLSAPYPTDGQAVAASEELLRRTIWHLQLAGFQSGRQRNPSGAISNDKLTIVIEGAWRAYDIFMDYGVAGKTTRVIFLELGSGNPIPDSGIPD
jgi:hypothetical protein